MEAAACAVAMAKFDAENTDELLEHVEILLTMTSASEIVFLTGLAVLFSQLVSL